MNANGINCASDISEQGEFTPEPLPLKPAERLRAFAVALNRAEAVIGSRVGPGLQMRAQHILRHARTSKLDAGLYELAWWVDRSFRAEHVILDNGTSPGINRETA